MKQKIFIQIYNFFIFIRFDFAFIGMKKLRHVGKGAEHSSNDLLRGIFFIVIGYMFMRPGWVLR